MAKIELGCCTAYCKTCRAFRDGSCKGCRLGYKDGKRDIRRAKCKIKVCCMTKENLETCADCRKFASCEVVQDWYEKASGAHKRYRKSAEFIIKHGYDAFITQADQWRDAGGKLRE